MVDTDVQHLLTTRGMKLQMSLYVLPSFFFFFFFHCSRLTSKLVIESLTDGTNT